MTRMKDTPTTRRLVESALSIGDAMQNVDEAQVLVNTSAYVASHGKEPKGAGSWAFAYSQGGKPFFIKGQMSYADAKKQAQAKAKADGKRILYTQP